jgi:membrane protein
MKFLNPKGLASLFKQAAKGWSDDKAPRLGAALAYYTIFSIAPLLLIVIAVAGLWFHQRDYAQQQILDQVTGMVGENGAKAIEGMLASAQKPASGMMASIIGVVTLLLGATGVFIQLQDALNSIWKVKQEPGGGIITFVTHRLLSFAMIISIGFLLLVSLVLSAALAGLGKYVGGFLPGWTVVGEVLNFVISFGVITVLFALTFKILPDVKIRFRDVWVGAMFTAALFVVGKALLGLYLGRKSVASAYGVFGSLVVLLLWVYYSAQILFFGCEITRVHAVQTKAKVVPKKHAVWISESEALGEPKSEAKAPAYKPPQKKPPSRDHDDDKVQVLPSPRPAKAGFKAFPSFVALLLVATAIKRKS